MKSPIYWHPWIYECGIRFLYGSNYQARLQAMADRIPEGSSVLDICAGDCAIHRYALRKKKVDYAACDSNHAFVHWAATRGIKAIQADAVTDALPKADSIIMMISLYQFIPKHERVIQKMIDAANHQVIISEPIRNWAQSENGLLRWIGKFATRIGSANHEERFTEQSLMECLSRLGFTEFQTIADGREILAVYKKPQINAR